MVGTDMKERRISATQFKARCLALMDEVARSEQESVITKHKHDVVRVVPAQAPVSLRGSVRYLVSEDDLLAPIDTAWDVDP